MFAVYVIAEKVALINDRKSPFVDAEIECFLVNGELDLTVTFDKQLVYQDAEFVIIATPTHYDPKNNYFNTSSVESEIQDVSPMR